MSFPRIVARKGHRIKNEQDKNRLLERYKVAMTIGLMNISKRYKSV